MATTGDLLTILTVICLHWATVQGANYKYISSCYESPVKTLEMECGPNEMLRIARAFYGYSPSGKCSFSQGDCTFDEHQNYACVGRQSCTINMPGGLGRPIPKCPHGRLESNYFQVEYQCVPVAETKNICETPEVTGSSGYISSPAYPLNYVKDHKCHVSIKLASNQKLRLYIVDMNLRKDSQGQGCTDDLYITSTLRSVTVCGQRGFEEIFDSSNSDVDIWFKATPGGDNKGFWLYYEAIPPMVETTTPAATTTTRKSLLDKITAEAPVFENEVTIEIEKPSEQSPITSEKPTTSDKLDDPIPFAGIVGGVIGSLCFILTILLILLLLQRVRERREAEKKKHLPFLDVRNEAFQSNSEICSQDSNYC